MPKWLDDAKANAAAKTAKNLADAAWTAARKEIDGLISPLEEELARRQAAAAPPPEPPPEAMRAEAEQDRAIALAEELQRMKEAHVPEPPKDPFAAAEAALARAREARRSVGRSREVADREASARAQLEQLKGNTGTAAPPPEGDGRDAAADERPRPAGPVKRRL
jgi:hypothetical protein